MKHGGRERAAAGDGSPGAGERGALVLAPPVDPRPRIDVGPPFRRFNSGWLALDFVNTVPGWLRGGDGVARPAGERLERYRDLLHWSGLQHLLGEETAAALAAAAASAPRRAASVVRRAHRLRGALHALFTAGLQGGTLPVEALAGLDAEQARLRRHEHLVQSGAVAVLRWVGAAGDLEVLLWPPVRSAVTLLTAPELMARVGECGGPRCGWLFLDAGRGQERRWCDSRDCGNVVKARAFRARRRHA